MRPHPEPGAPAWHERSNRPLHLAVAVLTAALFAGSPWVTMVTRLPRNPGWGNWAHLVGGLVLLALLLVYVFNVAGGGRWRGFLPWRADVQPGLAAELRGLLRLKLPAVEGGALFPLIEALLLMSLLATAGTGLGWLVTQGGPTATDWGDLHILAARVALVLAVTHMLAVSSHLLDFVRG